jgi:hypothetical protein
VVVWGWSEDGMNVERVEVSLDGGLTWAEAMLADERMADGRWQMADGTILEPPPAVSHPPSGTSQPSAKLWAFAGKLPADGAELLVLARGTDTAGNVEWAGPAVRLHRVVTQYWLPLIVKGWQAPVAPTPTATSAETPTPTPTPTEAPAMTSTPTPTVTPTAGWTERRIRLPLILKNQ